jgi:GNAT superfamily N-acetyltransferase
MGSSVFPSSSSSIPPGAGRIASSSEGRWRIVPASQSDVAVVQKFLGESLTGLSADECRASFDEPGHHARQRLLLMHENRIAGHARILHRMMRFGPLCIPAACFSELVVRPDLRSQGHGQRLLAAAEEQALRDGALVGFLRTLIPHFFRKHGWALCGQPKWWRAGTLDVLSKLTSPEHRARAHPRFNIRPWRRVELASLVRLYEESTRSAYGPFDRDEAHWHWLTQRRGYDQLHVVLDGPDRLEFEEANSPIIGYAAISGESVVELVTEPSHPSAAKALLSRVCTDAIERGRHAIALQASPDHPKFELFRSAGGVPFVPEAGRDALSMARLLDPKRLLQHMASLLQRRAMVSGLALPVRVGFSIEGHECRLDVDETSVRCNARHFDPCVQLNVADFTRMVLGNLDWNATLAAGRVTASADAAPNAMALFPSLPFWRPTLDDLPAPG